MKESGELTFTSRRGGNRTLTRRGCTFSHSHRETESGDRCWSVKEGQNSEHEAARREGKESVGTKTSKDIKADLNCCEYKVSFFVFVSVIFGSFLSFCCCSYQSNASPLSLCAWRTHQNCSCPRYGWWIPLQKPLLASPFSNLLSVEKSPPCWWFKRWIPLDFLSPFSQCKQEESADYSFFPIWPFIAWGQRESFVIVWVITMVFLGSVDLPSCLFLLFP